MSHRRSSEFPASGAIAVITAIAGVACAPPRSDPPAARGVLTVSAEQTGSWVRNFNPLLAAGSQRWPTLAGIYEPLLVFNSLTGEWVPWLATDHEISGDQRRITFTVRSGVQWSDGRPLRPEDVVFTFELSRRFPALDTSGVWEFVEGVRAEGQRVSFSLKRPYAPGLVYLAHQPIVPEHIWRDVADPVTFTNDDPVATGPFTEVRTFGDQVYELGRNPRYWQPGRPGIDGLRFPAFPGNDPANLALIHGDVDWAGNFIPAIERTYVARDPEHFHYWFPPVDGTVMLYANVTRAPFDDVRVRKAISLSIDRALLVKVAMYDYTKPADATGLSAAYDSWRDPAAVAAGDWVGFDVVRANQLLDQAGLGRGADGVRRGNDGSPLSYDVECVSGWSDWIRAAQVIARGLGKIGVRAQLKTYDFGAWFERVQKGEFSLTLGWTVQGTTPYLNYKNLMAMETVKPVGEPSAANWQRFGSAKASELLTRMEQTADVATERSLAAELQRLFVSEAPAIPLFPGPSWGEYNTRWFTGFPSPADPYAKLTPNAPPDYLLVLTRLERRR